MPDNYERLFELLLDKMSESIDEDVRQNDIYRNVSADNFWKVFEKDVAKKLEEVKASVGVPDWTIVHQGGHKFPDITVKISDDVTWGVEVKTISVKETEWVTMGGSIMESTSDHNITNIYLVCAKKDPFEIKCRKFEECVRSVKITHSPRYELDMNLSVGETIFDKVTPPTTYEAVRNSPNPFASFRDYLTQELDGKETWWNYTSKILEDRERMEADFVAEVEESKIRFFGDIPTEEREKYNAILSVLYPEVIKRRCDYSNALIWLFKHSIISNAIRDNFSAGSLVDPGDGQRISSKVYRIFVRRQLIIDFINSFNKGANDSDRNELRDVYTQANSPFEVWTIWREKVQDLTGFLPHERQKLLEYVDSIGLEIER